MVRSGEAAPRPISATRQHRRIEVASTTAIAITDWHVFEDYEIAPMPKGFSVHAAFFHRSFAMLAFEIVRGSNHARRFRSGALKSKCRFAQTAVSVLP